MDWNLILGIVFGVCAATVGFLFRPVPHRPLGPRPSVPTPPPAPYSYAALKELLESRPTVSGYDNCYALLYGDKQPLMAKLTQVALKDDLVELWFTAEAVEDTTLDSFYVFGPLGSGMRPIDKSGVVHTKEGARVTVIFPLSIVMTS